MRAAVARAAWRLAHRAARRPAHHAPSSASCRTASLHYLPFAALPAGRGLLRATPTRCSTCRAPASCRSSRRSARPAPTACSRWRESRPVGLPPLRFADVEADSRRPARTARRPLLGRGRHRDGAARAEAPRAGILHLAAHGELNEGNPLFSRIFLGAGRPERRLADGAGRLRAEPGASRPGGAERLRHAAWRAEPRRRRGRPQPRVPLRGRAVGDRQPVERERPGDGGADGGVLPDLRAAPAKRRRCSARRPRRARSTPTPTTGPPSSSPAIPAPPASADRAPSRNATPPQHNVPGGSLPTSS